MANMEKYPAWSRGRLNKGLKGYGITFLMLAKLLQEVRLLPLSHDVHLTTNM